MEGLIRGKRCKRLFFNKLSSYFTIIAFCSLSSISQTLVVCVDAILMRRARDSGRRSQIGIGRAQQKECGTKFFFLSPLEGVPPEYHGTRWSDFYPGCGGCGGWGCGRTAPSTRRYEELSLDLWPRSRYVPGFGPGVCVCGSGCPVSGWGLGRGRGLKGIAISWERRWSPGVRESVQCGCSTSTFWLNELLFLWVSKKRWELSPSIGGLSLLIIYFVRLFCLSFVLWLSLLLFL